MALVKLVEPGTRGWNIVHYTDGTKYIGYTDGVDYARSGLGTLYAEDGSILARGVWDNNELEEDIQEPEFGIKVNQSMQ